MKAEKETAMGQAEVILLQIGKRKNKGPETGMSFKCSNRKKVSVECSERWVMG